MLGLVSIWQGYKAGLWMGFCLLIRSSNSFARLLTCGRIHVEPQGTWCDDVVTAPQDVLWEGRWLQQDMSSECSFKAYRSSVAFLFEVATASQNLEDKSAELGSVLVAQWK